MAKGKDYTTTEIEEILSFHKDGLTYKEIAELMGRTETAIRCTISRYRHLKKDKKNLEFNIKANDESQQKAQEPGLFNQTEEVKKVVEKMTSIDSMTVAEPVSILPPAPPTIIVKEKTLADFTERQIIKHLWDRGYRWENMYCLVKQKVNLDDIIKNG